MSLFRNMLIARNGLCMMACMSRDFLWGGKNGKCNLGAGGEALAGDDRF